MKIFFVTFFIAELIIAIALISKIWQLDRFVIKFNRKVTSSKNKIAVCFSELRLLFEAFNHCIFDFKNYVAQKRKEYALKVLKNFLLYGGFFMLKGKYKKSIIAYQLLKEVYAGYKEAEV